MREDADHIERFRIAMASRYRILREIGRGGMATVYLADDLRHNRRVAIKVLRSEIAAALGAERFAREIQIAAVLAHPHILPLHDSGETDGFAFYVMPFVEGESLRHRLARERQLPIEDAVRITQEVADGLSYAHRLGVVHRDIKPENILFVGGHAVIADFGIATALAAHQGERLTASGSFVGTPMYMSPEQAMGEGAVDGRSDTYSLGCVLYEMLSGEPPFSGSMQTILARTITEPPPRLSLLRMTVSPALEEAVGRALSKTPADRFDTPADFASAVVAGAAPHASHLSTPRQAVSERSRSRSRGVRAGIVVGGLVLVAGIVWLARSGGLGAIARRPDAGAPAPAVTIAVLPFENLGATDDEYLAAGMADEVTNRLAAVGGLSVVPRRTAQRFARSEMSANALGREVGADYLLFGTVRRSDRTNASGTVRIIPELIGVRDERLLWSKSYDRVIDDVLDVQADIVRAVTAKLGVALRDTERRRLGTKPTSNQEAYTLYLKGRYFWNKRSAGNIERALDHFQQAADLDPSYALAWAGIADVWIFRGWYSLLAPRETFPKAKAAVQRALQFDSTLAEAHASMAHINLEFEYDWDVAEREYRRAIELDSSYAIAHHWYGGYLSAMGRHTEALQQAEIARRLDPLSLIIQTWVGLRYYFAGKSDAAIAEYRKALELDSTFAPAHWHLGWAYEQAGRFAESVAEAEHALSLTKENPSYLASLGRAYARAGRRAEARAVLSRLAAMGASRHVPAYHIASLQIALGDTSAALDWLDRAYEERSPWIAYLAVDPAFKSVRSHPRFARLLDSARLR